MTRNISTYLVLTRLTGRVDSDRQTLGELEAVIKGKTIFKCCTLELPWRQNQRGISCIPTGAYQVTHRTSPRYKLHLHVLDVPNRDWILIHPANFVRQLEGCIAPGESFIDIDGDGLKDVTNSRKTLDRLLDIMPSSFPLYIENQGTHKTTVR